MRSSDPETVAKAIAMLADWVACIARAEGTFDESADKIAAAVSAAYEAATRETLQ